MKHNEIYLKHILDEIIFLLKTTENLNYDSFLESEMYTRAFSRSFEIIGEAVKNLSQISEKNTVILNGRKSLE
jgi:uncharacterized protein with HEPN domain